MWQGVVIITPRIGPAKLKGVLVNPVVMRKWVTTGTTEQMFSL